jgi:hypothetical protein
VVFSSEIQDENSLKWLMDLILKKSFTEPIVTCLDCLDYTLLKTVIRYLLKKSKYLKVIHEQ